MCRYTNIYAITYTFSYVKQSERDACTNKTVTHTYIHIDICTSKNKENAEANRCIQTGNYINTHTNTYIQKHALIHMGEDTSHLGKI